jgi:hypothetical protein
MAFGAMLGLLCLAPLAKAAPAVPSCAVLSDGGNCGTNTIKKKTCEACCDAYCTFYADRTACYATCAGKP